MLIYLTKLLAYNLLWSYLRSHFENSVHFEMRRDKYKSLFKSKTTLMYIEGLFTVFILNNI